MSIAEITALAREKAAVAAAAAQAELVEVVDALPARRRTSPPRRFNDWLA